MWKLLLIVLAGQASKTNALEAVVCDCKSANQTGILDFKDECTINTTAHIFKEVQYWIYSTEPKPRPVLATVCTQRIRKRVISTGWLGNTDLVLSTLPKETTSEECAILLDTKQCGREPMEQTCPYEWLFNQEPLGGSSWGKTVSIEILNCEVRLINLTHYCAGCPVHTPMGPINLKIGTATGHHVRLNWNVSQPKQHQCENRQLSKGGIGF